MEYLVVMMMITGGAGIRVTRTSENVLVRSGSSLSLYCHTDTPWFFCVWTSPRGDKQCAIQENRVSSVCEGEPRIVISGGDNMCSITISNVTGEDWGDWMCVAQDSVDWLTDRRHVSVEVGHEAETSVSWSSGQETEQVLRVIEDSVTSVQCSASVAYPEPSIIWSAGQDSSDQSRYQETRYRDQTRANDDQLQLSDLVTSTDTLTRHYDNTTHEWSVVSSLTYTASINDTNTTLVCSVVQDNLYSQTHTIRVIVEPKPLPLIKVVMLVLMRNVGQ